MDFPILTSHLSDVPGKRWPSRRQSVLTTIAAMEQAHKAGVIANPVYQDAKVTLNRAIETAAQAIRQEKHLQGHWMDMPIEIRTFEENVDGYGLSLHTLPGRLKKAEKFAVNEPYCLALTALLHELAPLAAMMDALKGMAVKRTAKPVEERQPGYHPPSVSSEAQRQVVALLEEITQASYDVLRDALAAAYARWLEDYAEHAALASEHGQILSAYDYFVKRRYPRHAELEIVRLVTTTSIGVGQPQVHVRKPEWQAILARKAKDVADHIRQDFVTKNFRKIASLVEAKGNYTGGKVISHVVDLAGLTGRLVFEFDDGSSFVAQNAVVHVVNHYGTRFSRFPLTFHDVKLPGGTPMKLPSEERMNSIFVGKVAA